MLKYKNLINGILTGGLLFSLLTGTGCSPSEQPTSMGTGTPTPTLEQVITQTPQARDAQANLTPTAIPFMPTPFPHDEKSEMPLDSKLAFVARDGDYVQDIWITNGSEVRRMTHNLYEEEYLSWSPDGEMIAYIEHNPDSRLDYLKIMNVETGEARDIYSSGYSLRKALWHPEENLIVFQENNGHIEIELEDGTKSFDLDLDLNIIDPFTRETKTIVDLEKFTKKIEWIHDGGIVYLDYDGNLLYGNIDGSNYNFVNESVDWFDISWDTNKKIFKSDEDDEGITGMVGFIYGVKDTSEVSNAIVLNNASIIYESSSEEEKGLILIKFDEYIDEVFRRDLLDSHSIEGKSHLLDGSVSSISVDENQLLFSVSSFGRRSNEQKFLFSLDGRYLRELDFGQEYPLFSNIHSFAWSPIKEDLTLVRDEDIEIVDNYRVAEPESIDETLVFLASDPNGKRDIWKLRGNNLENLTKDGDDLFEYELSVFPSGERIFYLASDTGGPIVGYVMDIDGENKQQVYNSTYNYGIDTSEWRSLGFTQWSPDEKYISFLVYPDNDSRQRDLFLLNLETEELERVRESVDNYDWSPDGKDILFASYDYFARYNLEEHTNFIFDHSSFEDSEVKYSPDGKKFLISAEDAFNNRLYVGEITEEHYTNLRVIEDNYSGQGVSWSPDSQYIVYSVYNKEQIEDNLLQFKAELFIINADGSEKRKIDEIIYEDTEGNLAPCPPFKNPKFSPDGDMVVYLNHCYGDEFLYAISDEGDNKIEIPFQDTPHYFSSGNISGYNPDKKFDFVP